MGNTADHSKYRLGVDMGTNSLGWCCMALDDAKRPRGVIAMGTSILSPNEEAGRDPQRGTSLAKDRRDARSMRRRRDRYLLRRSDFMQALVRHGLMPSEPARRKALESLDPYELRARGLDEKLSLHELGRALFHLHQRRGFKSNRKTDTGKDKESGKIKDGVGRLKQAMAEEGARTIGEFLWRRHKDRLSVRARLHGEGAKATFDFYPERGLVEEEFDRLWEAQAKHHAGLNGAARDELRAILFRQRALRPVDPGKCSLDPSDARAPRALPRAQLFRIYQELSNLRVVTSELEERPLSLAERDLLADKLRTTERLKFERAHRLLKLDPGAGFNLASEKQEYLKGDETAKALAHKQRFGKAWRALDLEQQTEVVERLLAEEDEDALVAWLCESHGLEAAAARRVAGAPLPDGYARLGRRALGKIVSELMTAAGDEFADPATGEILIAPIGFAAAAERAGYHHSDMRPDSLLDSLPYYGAVLDRHVSGSGRHHDRPEARYGRVANPTVHIGLNQLRRLVNAVIAEHGRPDQIVVELARQLKQSAAEKARIQKEQAENQRKNDARREKLGELGQPDTGANRLRLRLWEELNPDEPHNRRCVYSGKQVSAGMLFGPEVEIDHILPFSMTLDDGAANKIVSLRFANRAKGNRPPAEAFKGDPGIAGFTYNWDDIVARAQNLPGNKRWRFQPEAMERFTKNRNFLDRQLTDTAYLARLTREYLCHICKPENVWVTPGRLTGMLRAKWGLNALLWDHNLKKRIDHRHHAIDAFVIAATDRGLLNAVARAAARAEAKDLERLFDDLPPPWQGYDREDLRGMVEEIVIYHRPDRGTQGKLHEETAYGLVSDPDSEGDYNLVYRKPFAGLSENEIERIRDRALRRDLQEHVHTAKRDGVAVKQALADFNEARRQRGLDPVRRVRLLKKEAAVIPIRDGDGRAYKAYSPGDNHRIEIFALPNGKWAGQAVTVFDANQKGREPAWERQHPGARLVMRVHKGDLLKIEEGATERVVRVVRLSAKANRLYLAGHSESGDLQKRHDDPEDPFRWLLASYNKLRDLRARRVRVDTLGRLNDPGPPS